MRHSFWAVLAVPPRGPARFSVVSPAGAWGASSCVSDFPESGRCSVVPKAEMAVSVSQPRRQRARCWRGSRIEPQKAFPPCHDDRLTSAGTERMADIARCDLLFVPGGLA